MRFNTDADIHWVQRRCVPVPVGVLSQTGGHRAPWAAYLIYRTVMCARFHGGRYLPQCRSGPNRLDSMNYFGGALAVELTPVKGAEPEGEHNTRRRAKCRLNSRSTLQDKQRTFAPRFRYWRAHNTIRCIVLGAWAPYLEQPAAWRVRGLACEWCVQNRLPDVSCRGAHRRLLLEDHCLPESIQ